MRLNNYIKVTLATIILTGCGGGTCVSNGNNGSIGNLSLALTAPNQYPAGVPATAYLTITNTSQVNASNLTYSVPSATNYTGVNITVNPTGAGQNCTNIASGASCTFTADIPAGSHPGSFTVTATSDGSTNNVQNVLNKMGASVGIKATTLSLTANIGLVNTPNTLNQFYILPDTQTIPSNTNSSTNVMLSVLVKNTVPSFNNIKLVDNSNVPLVATLLSPAKNSYQANDVLTYNIIVPAGTILQNVQAIGYNANTAICDLNDGTNINSACSNNAIINLATSGTGILSIQPNYLNMSFSYNSQVVTLTNIGTGAINALALPNISAPLSIQTGSNTCSSNLAVGQNCKFIINYTAQQESGESNLTFNYNNSIQTTNSSFAVNYASAPAPTLVTFSPTNNTSSVISYSGINLTFSIVMDPTTLIGANIKLQRVSDSSYIDLVAPLISSDQMTVSFATSQALASNATYQIIIPTPASIKGADTISLNLPNSSYPNGIISSFTSVTYGSGCSGNGNGYILNQATNSITGCDINSDGGLSNCSGGSTAITGLNSPVAGIANGNDSYAAYYIANAGDSSIGTYDFSNNFTLLSPSNISQPTGIASYSGDPIYVANSNGTLTECTSSQFNPYPLQSCNVVVPTPTNFPSSAFGLGVLGLQANIVYYTADATNNTIMMCSDAENLGSITSCSNAGGSNFNQPVAFTGPANSNSPYLLIVNSGNSTVTRCDADSNTGGLSNCNITGSNFNNPSAIYEYSGKAYITNKADSTVTICDDSSGSLSNCNRVQYGFSTPTGFTAFNPCD